MVTDSHVLAHRVWRTPTLVICHVFFPRLYGKVLFSSCLEGSRHRIVFPYLHSADKSVVLRGGPLAAWCYARGPAVPSSIARLRQGTCCVVAVVWDDTKPPSMDVVRRLLGNTEYAEVHAGAAHAAATNARSLADALLARAARTVVVLEVLGDRSCVNVHVRTAAEGLVERIATSCGGTVDGRVVVAASEHSLRRVLHSSRFETLDLLCTPIDRWFAAQATLSPATGAGAGAGGVPQPVTAGATMAPPAKVDTVRRWVQQARTATSELRSIVASPESKLSPPHHPLVTTLVQELARPDPADHVCAACSSTNPSAAPPRCFISWRSEPNITAGVLSSGYRLSRMNTSKTMPNCCSWWTLIHISRLSGTCGTSEGSPWRWFKSWSRGIANRAPVSTSTAASVTGGARCSTTCYW